MNNFNYVYYCGPFWVELHFKDGDFEDSTLEANLIVGQLQKNLKF